nr:hypothetical protein BaRGS_010398 [Batillaria attramentaria]
MGDSKAYDLVIFGATGFTGQFVVDEVARVAEEEGGLKWAVAGRTMAKLQKVLEQSSQRTGKNLEEIPIIIADVSNYQSLLDMSQQAKVVLNCVGPFLEKMQLMYNAKAKENSLYIVGACGFDSIPADLGILYTRNNFKGDLNSVEGYLNLSHGPDIKESGFSWTFFASGYSQTLDDPEAQHEEAPDKKMVTKVSGPEPGYVTTPICMVQAAVVLVKERDRLPKDGGVYTPAVAFGDTSLVERLDKHNVRFQIVEQ